jgi:hypothetical protein
VRVQTVPRKNSRSKFVDHETIQTLGSETDNPGPDERDAGIDPAYGSNPNVAYGPNRSTLMGVRSNSGGR